MAFHNRLLAWARPGVFLLPTSALVALALALAAAFPAQAADDWINAGSGDWSNPANWSATATPGAADNAFVLNGGTAQVTTVVVNPSTIAVGNGSTIQVSGAGRLGSVGSISVGETTAATLSVTGGGQVTVGDRLFVTSGAAGTLLQVDGSGSLVNVTGAILVGNAGGSGTATVSNGGVLQTQDQLILGNGGAAGTLNIGSGTGAGILNTTSVTTGGSGVINFNHSDSNYFFTADGTSAGAAINVSNNIGLKVLGGGTTTLTGNNSYSGTTTLTSGTLRAGSGGAFSSSSAFTVGTGTTLDVNGQSETIGSLAGAGSVTLGTGSLTAGGDNSSTLFSGTITGSGTTGGFSKTGTGTLTLSGSSSYTGSTDVQQGTLKAGAANNFSSSSSFVVGSTLDLNGFDQAIGSLDGAGSVVLGGATLTAGGNNATSTFSGVISDGSGAGSLIKTGTGTQVLSGANSYTGVTTISAGTLQLGNGGTTGSIVGNVIDNATLAFNRSDAVTFGGVISGSGGVNQIGSGTTTLSGVNTYSGGTVINAGTVAVSSDVNLGDTSGGITLDGGRLQFLASMATGRAVTLEAGGGTLDMGGNNVVFSGSVDGAGPVTFSNGVAFLGAPNTYTGPTTVEVGGTLAANVAGAFSPNSDFTVDGLLVLSGSANTIKSLSGTGGVYNGAAANTTLTIAPPSGSTTFSGALSDNGLGTLSLVKSGAGTQVLSGTNTYTGTTDVNAGTLNVTGSIGSVGTPGGAIGVLAGATLSVGATGSINIAGDLTNAGTVTVAAGGTITDDLINSGVVTNAGVYNANVATNTGTITNTNIWNGNVLSSTGAIINSATWNGDISTGGTFTNAGAITGTLTNTAGTTTNNGSISGAVTVSGGTFKGTGSTGNLIIGSGAVFAPGDGTPGTSATVNGSLAFSSGAFYQVAINPTTASFVSATGTATLTGATVQAFFSSGSYVAKQYTIVNAGSVNGSFNTLANTNLPSGFNSTLSYDGTHAYLDLALNFTPPTGPSLNVNQRNVANTLVNFFNSNGSIPIAFGSLTPAGLTQASGETATGTQQTTFDAMNLFMGMLMDPFVAGRGDGAGSGPTASGYAAEGYGVSAYAPKDAPRSQSERDAYAAIYRKAPPIADPFTRRWSVWAAGYGGSQTTDGNASLGSNSTTSSVFGTAVGADYRISPDTLAGFALAGGGTNFSVANGGSGRSDLFQAGAFIRHTVGEAYISGALAYGWQDITTNRTVSVAGTDQLRAEFNANAFSGRLEGGYRFVSPWVGGIGITPYAAAQFTTFNLPAYAEQATVGANAFALAYGGRDVTDARSEFGIRTDKSYAMQGAILTLRSRFAWAHDFDPDRSIGATFQTLPGASFVVNGAAQAHDSALTTASVEMQWLNGWSTAVTFEGEFSDVTESYAGKGVVRYQW